MKAFIITNILFIIAFSIQSQSNLELTFFVENYHEINTHFSELSLVPYGNDQILVSNRGIQDKKGRWSGNAPFNLYFRNSDGDSKLMSSKLNSDFNDGPIAVVNEKLMYITTNNRTGQIDPLTKKMVYRLNISKAEFINNKWVVIEVPELTDKRYSYAHPSISSDGKMLYFVSDRPGGLGATDIYKCSIGDGSLSEPENLGDSINTQYEEQFPFYHAAGYLFFSSRRKGGKGGLDIYYSKKRDSHSWSTAKIMEGDINTQAHESSIYLNKDLSAGYFTSNRMGGHGSDDIYLLHAVDRSKEADAIPLASKEHVKAIELVEVDKSEVESLTSNNDDVNGSLEKVEVATPVLKTQTNLPKRVMLETVNMDIKQRQLLHTSESTIYTVLENKIVERKLNNAYFNSNSAELSLEARAIIRELAIILNEDESAIIELHAHTDAKGEFERNAQLSELRARAVIKALALEGVSVNRIRYLAYGETSLAINTKTEARLNRRVEFKIIDPNSNKGTVDASSYNVLRNIKVLEKNKFYVQVAAINKSKTINRFKLKSFGIPISYYDKGMYKYVIGPYNTMEEAKLKRIELEVNYPGAFIYLNVGKEG